MKVLITGAGGFVGQRVVAKATSLNYAVCATSRLHQKFPSGISTIGVGSIDESTNWRCALIGCEAVIHLAARAHILNDSIEDSLAEFRRVNVSATLNLARQAAISGVRRFIFVSSIGVNGAETFGQPFSADDLPSPHSDYSVSKFEAEQGLMILSSQTGMEVVIVRPPLVYGPNAPGNFGSLMRWISSGVPLPLGSIYNKRSFVGLDNLADFLCTCLQHPAASGQIFLVSDGEDVSTSELLRRTAHAMGKKAFLIPVPVSALELCSALIGKRELSQRLCGSLHIDITKTRSLLGWNPSKTLNEGLKITVEGTKL